ncbi:hypothetical protein C100_17290 [Sphingobium sp. C100]|jgi:hypothetical protein|uniref:hypothetical protein n=1 Tax=Sphingobium sp. C100 TaxID=1207055 RepID=UPI0003D6721C|nr:hypothetical protein [Sphingobium sp. C100]ETI61854.1 hypothetical protein C100_17290 [Sphingobium sp. C100]PHQ62624.1 MAG: hypothetical protein COC10_10550 [Sphingobium sp.]
MDSYVSRTELSPVDRAVVRAPSAVSGIQPPSASGVKDALAQEERRGAMAQSDLSSTGQELASVAEYVEVHARIAEILADLSAGMTDVEQAQDAIQSMLPRPIILVPLPPASKEAVEHAAVIARRMVERAAYAHAGQAHLARATVEQVAASST